MRPGVVQVAAKVVKSTFFAMGAAWWRAITEHYDHLSLTKRDMGVVGRVQPVRDFGCWHGNPLDNGLHGKAIIFVGIQELVR